MVIEILVRISPTIALGEDNPKSVIANLPKIDVSKQCDEKGECERTIEEKVFDTLKKLSDRYLQRGMPKSEVEKLFGRPTEAGVDSWKDVRFGNPVAAWLYAVSLSGTTGFYIIFVNDRMDYFG